MSAVATVTGATSITKSDSDDAGPRPVVVAPVT